MDDLKSMLFGDLVSLPEIAKIMDKSERTVDRLVKKLDVPITYIGARKHIRTSQFRAALLGEKPPAKRGRPPIREARL